MMNRIFAIKTSILQYWNGQQAHVNKGITGDSVPPVVISDESTSGPLWSLSWGLHTSATSKKQLLIPTQWASDLDKSFLEKPQDHPLETLDQVVQNTPTILKGFDLKSSRVGALNNMKRQVELLDRWFDYQVKTLPDFDMQNPQHWEERVLLTQDLTRFTKQLDSMVQMLIDSYGILSSSLHFLPIDDPHQISWAGKHEIDELSFAFELYEQLKGLFALYQDHYAKIRFELRSGADMVEEQKAQVLRSWYLPRFIKNRRIEPLEKLIDIYNKH